MEYFIIFLGTIWLIFTIYWLLGKLKKDQKDHGKVISINDNSIEVTHGESVLVIKINPNNMKKPVITLNEGDMKVEFVQDKIVEEEEPKNDSVELSNLSDVSDEDLQQKMLQTLDDLSAKGKTKL